ncbi:adapter molecule Crk isoform X2 [Apis laboriosa]|uniref:adapter molecule Crk isoform X2 n=1 Tax=Apis laboriosa TaxID=183418 RepID=UPI001CC3A3F4|nr:adapter molecule Crk isoform X2 [Apis laboriosa]
MAATFDQYDKSSWYFGAMSRQDASDLLMGEKEGGVFLGDQIRYRIGDQTFPDIPNLLAFYKLHYLDTTPLIRPAPKRTQRVVAKYDFEGNDPDDLPFRKGEILTIISKDEEQWWTARNALGQTGSVPVPYVQKYEEDNHPVIENNSRPESGGSSTINSTINSVQISASQMSYPESGQGTTRRSNIQRTLPAFAKVKQARVPNAYDKTALKLEVGDVIKVTKTNINGQWEGELHGKVGHFPFTHVEFVDNETGEDNQEI